MDIIDIETSATTVVAPTAPATAPHDDIIEAGGARLTRSEIADPHAFLATDRGAAWLAPTLSGAWFTMWYDHQRSPHDLKDCNEIAAQVLDTLRSADGCVEATLEARFSGGEDAHGVYTSDHEDDVAGRIADIADELEELDDPTLPDMDQEAWAEAVHDVVVEHMEENDDSSVLDMYGSFDRAEIFVRFTAHGDHVSCRGDLDSLEVDHNLRCMLGGLGYTMADYRAMRRNPADRDPARWRSGGARGGRVHVRARPLVTEKQLRDLVANVGSGHFEFVLHAVVPLTELFRLDLSRPVMLSKYAVAAYDGMNGNVDYEIIDECVVLEPGTCTIVADIGYSPTDICGVDTRGRLASIANPSEPGA